MVEILEPVLEDLERSTQLAATLDGEIEAG